MKVTANYGTLLKLCTKMFLFAKLVILVTHSTAYCIQHDSFGFSYGVIAFVLDFHSNLYLRAGDQGTISYHAKIFRGHLFLDLVPTVQKLAFHLCTQLRP